MATLADYATALQFRDLMKSLIKSEVANSGVDYYYATVNAVDYFNRKCTVALPDGSLITVNLHSQWPSYVGQVVKVTGKQGDQYVQDVLGPVALPANSYFKSVDDVDLGARSQWDGAGSWGNWIAKVVQDTLTFAYGATEDTAFTVNKNGLWTPASSGMSVASYQGGDAGSTTRTTYANTLTGSASGMVLNFVVPPSGRILIILNAYMRATAGVAYMAADIRLVSTNAQFSAPGDTNAVLTASTSNSMCSNQYVLAGLTPGATYKAVLNFRSSVSTSTAAYDNFRVTVVPSLGA